jgi:glycolate oxidase FAD binding subunit
MGGPMDAGGRPAELHAQPEALRALADRVRDAAASRTRLRIVGGDTKRFITIDPAVQGPRDAGAEALSTRGYAGIVSYEPSELVMTVRAGTPLAEVEAALAARGQCLPFEPPRFGVGGHGSGSAEAGGTVGGMVAAGLAGPARAAAGNVRDHVLGVLLLDGRGRLMRFGGEVIKNVAGYDVSRLVAGSWGALGLAAEVSIKVMPVMPAERTLRFEMEQPVALEAMNQWAGQPLPLNASVWWRGTLCVRLRGAAAAVEAATARLGGDAIPPALAAAFWTGLRDQRDEFFEEAQGHLDADPTLALWRLSLPSTAPALPVGTDPLIEWGGAQRWVLAPDTQAPALMAAAQAAGGAARPFRRGTFPGGADALEKVLNAAEAQPRRDPLAVIQRRLKEAFDPHDVFVAGAPIARELAPATAASRPVTG